jgi:hypothetical protein
MSGQLHAPAAIPPGKSPWYPFYRRLGGPQSWSGRYGEGNIFWPYRDLNSPPPGRPARSQSLYRLSYPGSEDKVLEIIFLQVWFYAWIVCHFLLWYEFHLVYFGTRTLLWQCSCKSLWSQMRFVVEVITIGGGLPDFWEPPSLVECSLLQ